MLQSRHCEECKRGSNPEAQISSSSVCGVGTLWVATLHFVSLAMTEIVFLSLVICHRAKRVALLTTNKNPA
jgi:hypothetical protein